MHFADATDILSDRRWGSYEYFPPKVTDNLIKSSILTWYRLKLEIEIPILCKHTAMPYSKTDCISLNRGDIIGLFSIHQTFIGNNIERYTMCLFNNKLNPLGIDKKFFLLNKEFFEDITTELNRNNIINQIIN